jgi:hypothetical protein
MSTQMIESSTNADIIITITPETVETIRTKAKLVMTTALKGVVWEDGDVVVRDAHETMSPYDSMKTPEQWHWTAGAEIVQYFDSCAIRGVLISDADLIKGVARLIFTHDPAMV